MGAEEGAEEPGQGQMQPAQAGLEPGEALLYDMYNQDLASKSKKPDAYKKLDKINDNMFIVTAREDGLEYVLKQKTLLETTEKWKEKIKFAFRALQMLNHPFIVQGKKVFTAKKSDLITILEYCKCKDLRTVLKTEHLPTTEGSGARIYMDEGVIVTYITQLALALEDTHTNKMNHRNFSSEHIFLKPLDTNNLNGPRCAMLGNYGNAIIQKDNVTTKSTITFNDPYYMSPENVVLYRSEESLAIQPGKKSDIFALGVLLLEMCNLERFGEDYTGGQPLWELQGAKGDAFTMMVSEAKDRYPNLAVLIDRLLTETKEERPLASEVLQISPVKETAYAIVTSAEFKQEMWARLKNKLTLGWASKDDINQYRMLWQQCMKGKAMTTDPKEVQTMVEKWAEVYQERVFSGTHADKYDYDNEFQTLTTQE